MSSINGKAVISRAVSSGTGEATAKSSAVKGANRVPEARREERRAAADTEFSQNAGDALFAAGNAAKRIMLFALALILGLAVAGNPAEAIDIKAPENFVLIKAGTFKMGSPETEAWRSADETQYDVTGSDFYLSRYEITQAEYKAVLGSNPSNFSGENLPVENITWLDAVVYSNARGEEEGLIPAYTVDGQSVSWDRSANGYRLPTEAEREYACRAGTVTPFNTQTSLSPDESNYYGHYPYEIEENYFSQGNLETEPGQYRQATVEVNRLSPNPFGLYNMHGNVSEWVWDYYGAYSEGAETDPVGADSGTLRVYRGGGWNDLAKDMRSAYRATMAQDNGSFNIGTRLALNAAAGSGSAASVAAQKDTAGGGQKITIAYFSWSGNVKGIAKEI